MGLRLEFYPTRLSLADLAHFDGLALYGFDAAPRFCGWLSALIQDEQVRRLRVARGEAPPVAVPSLPLDWPGRELGLALHAATAMSFSAPSYAAGRFIDVVVITLNAIVQHRLEQVA